MIDELKACRGSFITSIFPISGTNVRSHRFYDMTICIYMHYDELSLAELRRFFFWGAISKVLVPTEVERSFISTRTLDPMQCDPKAQRATCSMLRRPRLQRESSHLYWVFKVTLKPRVQMRFSPSSISCF